MSLSLIFGDQIIFKHLFPNHPSIIGQPGINIDSIALLNGMQKGIYFWMIQQYEI